jgi:hypothetical protein
MKSREIFRIALKIIGFIVLLQGLRNSVEALLVLKGYASLRLSTPQYWAAWAVIKIVVGTYLMMGDTPFISLAFPAKAAATRGESETTTPAGVAGASMEPKVLFGLAVKTLGLILVLYGLEYFLDALLYAIKTAESNGASGPNWVVFSIAELVLGLAMLRGMVPFVEFAFPGETTKGRPKAEETATEDGGRDPEDDRAP